MESALERGEGDIFQTVVLQRVRLVSGSRNICDRIYSRLDLWNRGALEKIVHDSYRATEEFLWNNHGDQTQEQRHRTF